ncbi:MAG: M23 family metallopeptidase [Clostridia bacterium]|nr:M23 family metallopeptidase [Clostridia bacterium]
MNRKTFTFESRNKKKIRLKDILMLLSVFALCFITVITTAGTNEEREETLGVTQTASNKEIAHIPSEFAENGEDIAKTETQAEENIEIIAQPPENTKREFITPVNGAIVKPFSKTELAYSRTMDDWRTHLGVDIACPYGTEVIASEAGEVKEIEYNINFGTTVTVESGEYILKYTSLSSDVYVSVGDKLTKGTIIGKTSDSCISEICDEPHFHFEVIKNGEHIDPLDIISGL